MKPDARTLFANSAWSLVHQVVRVGALALILLLLSRHFGPARFGALVFGLAFVRIFGVVSVFGLDRILVRRFVEFPNESNQLLHRAFRLKIGISLLAYTGLLAVVFVFDPRDLLALKIAALAGGSFFFQSLDIFDYFFQAAHRFRLIFFGRSLPILIMTVVKLGAVFAGASLLVFPALETVEAAVIGLSLFYVQRVTKPKPSLSQRCTTGNRELVSAGLPILLGSLAVMLYMRSDILLLGRMAGLEAAGIYAAAAQITEGCALFPMAFLPAVFPVLVRWRKLGLIQYEERFANLLQAAILIGFGIAIGLSLSAPIVLRLLYGNAYVSAALILGIHSWSAIFIYLSIMQSGYDIIEGLTWIAATRVAAGASLNIVLNLLLIPRHGGAGAALATLISQFCSSFLFNLFHRRTKRIFVLQLRAFLFIPLLHSMMRQLPNLRRSWDAGSFVAQE